MEGCEVVLIAKQHSVEVAKEEYADEIHKVDKQEAEKRDELQTQRSFFRNREHNYNPQNQ